MGSFWDHPANPWNSWQDLFIWGVILAAATVFIHNTQKWYRANYEGD